MNLRALECFVAVVDEGSFTRAARRVGITQPSLSQHVRALEKELEGPLFSRLPRGVALTPAGRTLLPEARIAIRAVERGLRSARSTLAVDGGELEIATVLSLAVGVLPRHIGVWHARYPNVSIRLHEFRHRSLLEDAVEQGVADFALGPVPVRPWDGPLGAVGWEEFVLVTPAHDELAQRQSVRLEELHDREWVLYHPDHGLAGIVETLCRGAGFTPRGTVRTSQAEGAVRFAAAGLGIALVPDNVVVEGIGCAVLKFEPRVVRDIAIYARVPLSPTAVAFVDVVRSAALPRPADVQSIHL
ncbi:MAG TPA: LysR family transcriptional regulator [Gaiellaceae bacterium]|nr:LysR family transcriptional regulator [Gaiellaceae bacterium]